MEPDDCFHPQLLCHRSTCGGSFLCDRRNIHEVGRNSWWTSQCHFRQRCRINRKNEFCLLNDNARMANLFVQVSIVALKEGQIRIVQSSMLGSILSNMLLVLGCCFIAGGIHNTRTGTAQGIEQSFNSTVASTMSSLMTVASASLILPATVSGQFSPMRHHNSSYLAR